MNAAWLGTGPGMRLRLIKATVIGPGPIILRPMVWSGTIIAVGTLARPTWKLGLMVLAAVGPVGGTRTRVLRILLMAVADLWGMLRALVKVALAAAGRVFSLRNSSLRRFPLSRTLRVGLDLGGLVFTLTVKTGGSGLRIGLG